MTARAAWVAVLSGICATACARPQPGGPPQPSPADRLLLDDFDDLAAWQAVASDGVQARVVAVPGTRGQALRLAFDLSGTSGYAVARKVMAIGPEHLADNFELSLQLRGELPINNFELKLIDSSGENVWWFHRANFEIDGTWRRLTVRKRQIEFAWGPTADKTLRQVAAVELVISAGQGGGKGWIEVDELAIRRLDTYSTPPPAPRAGASSSAAGASSAYAVDGKLDTAWRSAPRAGASELVIDLGRERDLGGLIAHWATPWAVRYDVEVSLDGKRWTGVGAIDAGDGEIDPLLFLDTPARWLRLQLLQSSGTGYAVAELELIDASAAPNRNAFISELARRTPRGSFPRGFSGEQAYWTLVGVDAGRDSGLLGEDGTLELRAGGASIEPFIVVDGKVTSWANAAASQTLEDRYLPIPSVTWHPGGTPAPSWELTITAAGLGDVATAQLAARYVVSNHAEVPLRAQLVLAVRPFQVNPATQFLNIAGGISPIRELSWAAADRELRIDSGRAAASSRVRFLSLPDRVELFPLHARVIPVSAPSSPPSAPSPASRSARLHDRDQLATAIVTYELRLPPHQQATIVIEAPLFETGAASWEPSPRHADPHAATRWFERVLASVKASWHDKLDRVSIRVPAAGAAIVETLRSSLAYLLLSRDGAMLRPGTRAYARAWIRDGAMISEALLRLGHPEVAADFLRWYTPYQFRDGKVPCCVDRNGAGPVPEHDSHGQLIYLARAVYRYTNDRELLSTVWPHLLAAAGYQEQLRQSERTAANQTPQRRALWGLLPPSISHEGYSARPAYSYWDDFWGLRGAQDVAALAVEFGTPDLVRTLAAQRDQWTRELHASIIASAAVHAISFIPGAADLGDFDATSTTIAVAPGVGADAVPQQLLSATFERAWRELVGRRDGSIPWTVYTPYELRVVATFVRMGWRERAEQALAFFLADRRPAAWNQWAEVVGKDPRTPRFLGDQPHAWVHSDYARSALDLFAYEREADSALVLAAGVPVQWLAGPGIAIERMATPWGLLRYTLKVTATELRLELEATAVPPGGFVVPWPFPLQAKRPGAIRSNGQRAIVSLRGSTPELIVTERTATVVVALQPGVAASPIGNLHE
jgi:F5/8 type C domain